VFYSLLGWFVLEAGQMKSPRGSQPTDNTYYGSCRLAEVRGKSRCLRYSQPEYIPITDFFNTHSPLHSLMRVTKRSHSPFPSFVDFDSASNTASWIPCQSVPATLHRSQVDASP
jgi:hypothetical protein